VHLPNYLPFLIIVTNRITYIKNIDISIYNLFHTTTFK